MCDPISASVAASAALSAGGMIVNKQQQNAATSANINAQNTEAARRVQAARDERARQDAITARGDSVNAQQLAENERGAVEARQAADAANRATGVDTATTTATQSAGASGPEENPLLRPSATATGVTVQDAARRTSERLGATRKGMLAQAYLSSVSDQQGERRRSSTVAGSDLDTLSGLRRGSLNAYNVDLNRETPTFRPNGSMLGDVMTLAGQAGAAYAGRRAGTAEAATSVRAPT